MRSPSSPMPRIRVLLVEDSEADAGLVRMALEADQCAIWDVCHVTCLRAAIRIMETVDAHPDVMIVDPGLPDSHGVTSVVTLRAVAFTAQADALGLSPEEMPAENAVKCVVLSGHDYDAPGFVSKDHITDGGLLSYLHRLVLGEYEDPTGLHLRESLLERLAAVGGD